MLRLAATLLGCAAAAAPRPQLKKLTPAEIAPFPPMQWHSWGLFTHEDLVTEANMNELADALVSSGMAAAGYDTVNVVCNGWAGRDPATGVLVENHTLWPTGMKGFAARLHSMTPPLKVGCYTSPRTKNCMCGPAPQGGCEEGTGRGFEQVDMDFFADVGCDHVMVDSPDSGPATFKERYATIGAAIANSSNPNMVYGVWNGGSGHAWKWGAEVGGHYWRIGTDTYDGWTSIMRQWDTTYSIPDIDRFTKPGSYSFLDQMIIGDIPHRKGSAYGPGLNHDEAVAHMSMFVMAATPLLTCTDVRNMSADIKAILTNLEVLAVHKDPLARMATRVDIGGGTNELRSSNLCPAQWPACQEAPGDPGFPGHPCTTCRSNWSVYEKSLHDNSSAVMVLNRGDAPLNVPVSLRDLGDSSQGTWTARDLWNRSELGVFANQMKLAVPAHGVRMLRMRPHVSVPPPPPPPLLPCPTGCTAHAPGLWSNPSPCGYPAKAGCQEDTANITLALCAKKCDLTKGCLAFEVYQGTEKRCFIFIDELKLPFIPVASCFACVKNNHSAPLSPPRRQLLASKDGLTLSGFMLGHGTFLLNGEPIRLFAGALQHFRIHPDHWAHRLALAKAMGLNAVQTLIPWMMMEPTPGEFKTDGFMDIVKFAQLAQKEGLLIVLRVGPFICDGPDYGGFPWWLTRQNTPATMNRAAPGALLRVRTADPAFLHRVDLFYTKLFALLRAEKLTADLGGPIIMAQIDNEYGLFGTDQAYLQYLAKSWRKGLGEGVVIHSTDPASPSTLGASRTPGVLQTVDFATQGDIAADFAVLRASQKLSSAIPQPLMVSEFYPGYITADGQTRLPVIYQPEMVAAQLNKVLNTTHCGGNTSFALWLFAGCTDFGFWGGTLFGLLGGIDLGDSLQQLTPSYDVGAPVDAAGVIRPLFHMLQAVLKHHGANVSSELPAQPPVAAYGPVVMKQRVPLWRALPALDPRPVRSDTVRTMEELGQGYGYIMYSAPVPQFEAPANVKSLALAGMRDRALVYFDRELYQTCHRGKTVDSVVCAAANATVNHGTHLDILVENQGRVTGGLVGTELPWRGISRYVALNGQILANWTITPLPLNDTELLASLWSGGDADRVDGPAFFRGEFTIGAGKVADTWLTLLGWQKGVAFVNGHNLARYTNQGPQFGFYCPAGWLLEGKNEVILFETGGVPANRTVELKSAQTYTGRPLPPGPHPTCPTGYTTHAPGLWSNPSPCGYPAKPDCVTDKVNVTVGACSRKCDLTKGCLAFEVYQGAAKACNIFIDELKLPFIPVASCFACVKNNHSSNTEAKLAVAPAEPLPLLSSSPRRQLGTEPAVNNTCPSGFYPHEAGLWSNPWPCGLTGAPGCHQDNTNTTVELCAKKCRLTNGCLAFEVYEAPPVLACYLFLKELKAPFLPDESCATCTVKQLPPPPPAPPPPPPLPPPPQRGKTASHTFPRLGNCWGADPFITPKQWNYLGFPNMTNASWGRYDVLYLNPFDSCCWKEEMDSWTPMVRAIKAENPTAIVLATYHATEIWEVDLIGPNHSSGWLPDKCRVRNTKGDLCSWWAGLVFTNNLFDPDCMNATVSNALGSLTPLIAAGVDGVFLDGVVDFDIGCSPQTPCNGNCHPTADINCTHAGCAHTPQRPWQELASEFVKLYMSWFEQLKAEYPHLVWVNNLAMGQAPFIPVSNGRQYEGGAGLDILYSGGRPISSFVSEIRMWSTEALQPSYLNLHMNGNMGGGEWRIGRWQNLVTAGEMMRLMTDFRRMRFGLGVALLTDGYFGYDVGSEMYGAPSFFTEYEVELGQAVADPIRIFAQGEFEVWTREFDHGFVIVSAIPTRGYNVTLPVSVHELPLSKQPQRLSGQMEAPRWSFVVEASGGRGSDESFRVAGHHDWWADDAHRASFRTIEGNWTVVSDETQSHNYGASFLVGFSMPGGPSGSSQGHPKPFSASWTFESPADGPFSISTTAVDAHLYPLTDGAMVCVKEAAAAASGGACLARSTIDQRAGIRDGRWQLMVASVMLRAKTSYEVVITWDPTCNGYVAADAILIESHRLFHGDTATLSKVVSVGAMDARVVLKG